MRNQYNFYHAITFLSDIAITFSARVQLIGFRLIIMHQSPPQKNRQFVPFGMGKRICAGESLATRVLFIFFVMLIQQLRFDVPLDHPSPNVKEYSTGITTVPKPFYVSISRNTATH